MANLWNSPEKADWKASALAIGSSSLYVGRGSCLVALAQETGCRKPADKPNFVISTGFRYGKKFAQLWQMKCASSFDTRKTTLDRSRIKDVVMKIPSVSYLSRV